MKKLVLTTILVFYVFSGKSQANDFEAALYNVSFGGLGSGIGAIINKKPEEKTLDVFFKGLWQGSLGGIFVYGSKKLVGEISVQEELAYSWPAKIMNAAGVSIIENASSNRNFWEQWNLHIGFNRIEFHAKDKFKVKYRVMPLSLGVVIGTAIGSRFDIERSIRTGEFFFTANDFRLPNAGAITIGNVIRARNTELDDFELLSHEFIHILQYYDFNIVNTYTNPWRRNLIESSRIYRLLDSFIYWDLNGVAFAGVYGIEEIGRNCKFDNFFEHEAEFYSSPTINCNQF